jgi:putative ABC transport system ATP-binding protein
MKAAITMRDIRKTYREGSGIVPVLHGLDIDVYSGEVVMLMGPSGGGKTTLLSIMGCILQACSGSIVIDGEEVSHLGEDDLPRIRREHIGFIFQSFNLFPALTAAENVELMLDVKGIRGILARKQARSLLTSVGLADKADTVPANLSGGQKQRVAIARALAGDPGIILADEPTAALDSRTGRSIMEMLRSLAHERGRAVVIVTHDPRVLEFADRTICMEDGKITEASANPQELSVAGAAASPVLPPLASALTGVPALC